MGCCGGRGVRQQLPRFLGGINALLDSLDIPRQWPSQEEAVEKQDCKKFSEKNEAELTSFRKRLLDDFDLEAGPVNPAPIVDFERSRIFDVMPSSRISM